METGREAAEGRQNINGEGTSLLPSGSESNCNKVPRSLQKHAGNQISRVSFNRGVSQDRKAEHVCGLMSESAEFRKPASSLSLSLFGTRKKIQQTVTHDGHT